MPLLLLAAAAGFVCATPVHRDGASIRCGDSSTSMVLDGIKALPPGGPCFRPDDCPEDFGRLAQDQLAELTRGRKIICTPTVAGKARCTANGNDLSCAMIASGFARSDGKVLGCPSLKTPPRALVPAKTSPFAGFEWLGPWLLGFLAAINLLTLVAFMEDRRRASLGLNRIADIHLLALALFGGGLGGFVVQQTTGHLRDEEPFASQLVVLLGLQIGAAIGFFAVPLG